MTEMPANAAANRLMGRRRTIDPRMLLLLILAISVAMRLAAAFYLGDRVSDSPGAYDQISYHRLALRVLDGHGFSFARPWWPLTAAGEPTAHWSYLYTLYLVAVYSLFGANPLAARLIQALIVGLLHPYLTYKLGSRLFGERVGLISAAITALYLYFVYYSATLMTEAFYITAILAVLYLVLQLAQPLAWRTRHLLLLGLLFGIVVLLRQLFLLLIPFLLLWLALQRHRYKRLQPRDVAQMLLPFATMVLMIAPFTLYNWVRFDQFVLLNTNAGFAFYWGNHPIYGTQFQPILRDVTYQELIPASLHGLSEADLERELMARGLRFVVDEPLRYLRLSLSRVAPYFMFWPSSQSGTLSNLSRVLSFGLCLPFMLGGLLLSLRVRTRGLLQWLARPVGLLYLFMLLYSSIHLLTWTLIRYRLPVDAVLILFAAVAVARVLRYVAPLWYPKPNRELMPR